MRSLNKPLKHHKLTALCKSSWLFDFRFKIVYLIPSMMEFFWHDDVDEAFLDEDDDGDGGGFDDNGFEDFLTLKDGFFSRFILLWMG